MKKILSYFSYVMFALSFLGSKYLYTYSDFANSISFIFLCIGCIFTIPDLLEELKEYDNTNNIIVYTDAFCHFIAAKSIKKLIKSVPKKEVEHFFFHANLRIIA